MFMNRENVIRYRGSICRRMREEMNGHTAKVFWFTGLSGSGKSTLAHRLEEELHRLKVRTYVFDGDNIRQGLCSDLSFSREARTENLRRIGEVLKLFVDAGVVCMAAFISPLEEDRRMLEKIVGEDDFVEIFVQCPLEVCEQRDAKGYYKMARAGMIENYTGISAPYEKPRNPEFTVSTVDTSVGECVESIKCFALQCLGL